MFLFHTIPTPTCATNPTRLRALNISPSGDWICGTYIEASIPRWWKAQRDPNSSTDPWIFTCGLGPGGVLASGRGINDNGDLVGFSSAALPLTVPMLVRNGSAPADFIIDAADAGAPGTMYCIDNAMNVGGSIQLKKNNALYPSYPQQMDIGYKTNADSPTATTNPQLVYDQWSSFKPGALIVRGMNAIGDVVGQINSGTNLEAFIILNHGTASQIHVNVAAHPFFSALTPTEVVISGINSNRFFVGWHTTNGVQHGLFGKVDDSGNIIFLNEVNHSGAVTPNSSPLHGTQLFGISGSNLMAGTFNNILPFICLMVLTPPPPHGDRPWLNDLLELGLELIQRADGTRHVRGVSTEKATR